MKTRLLQTLGLLAICLSACQTARMPLPVDLESAPSYVVDGRQGLRIGERLRFGPYEAANIERSWTGGRDVRLEGFQGSRRSQRYRFVLREDQVERWEVLCAASLQSRTVETLVVDITVDDRSSLECTLRRLDRQDEDWQLELGERGERPLRGQVSSADASIFVEGTRRLRKSLPADATTGYEIRTADQVLAAVEVVNRGTVWLHEEVPQDVRGVVAATTASLLLLEDLRAHLTL